MGLTMTWSPPSIFSGIFGDWLIGEPISLGSENGCCCLGIRCHMAKKEGISSHGSLFIWEEIPSQKTLQPLLPPGDFSVGHFGQDWITVQYLLSKGGCDGT